MAAKPEFLFVGCDNLIELHGARRADNGDFLNSATVTWGLYANKANAAAASSSLASGTLDYVLGSDGTYQGVLESSAYTLVDGTYYWLRINTVQDLADDVRILRRKAKYHEESP